MRTAIRRVIDAAPHAAHIHVQVSLLRDESKGRSRSTNSWTGCLSAACHADLKQRTLWCRAGGPASCSPRRPSLPPCFTFTSHLKFCTCASMLSAVRPSLHIARRWQDAGTRRRTGQAPHLPDIGSSQSPPCSCPRRCSPPDTSCCHEGAATRHIHRSSRISC